MFAITTQNFYLFKLSPSSSIGYIFKKVGKNTQSVSQLYVYAFLLLRPPTKPDYLDVTIISPFPFPLFSSLVQVFYLSPRQKK